MFSVLLLLTAFAVYGNTLSSSFVFDDIPLIVENSSIKDPLNIPAITGLENGKPYYRPVRILSYVIDYSISGLNPVAYHVSNIIYHTLTAFVLFCLLKLLFGSAPVAAFGALLFLVHPVQTDSVAYISGRRDILCGLFYISGFYSFVLYRTRGKNLFPVLSVIMYILAAGSKEMAVTLPAMCVLYDFSFHDGSVRSLLRRNLKFYLVMFLLAGCFLFYKLVLHYPSLRTEYYGGSAAANFATVSRVIMRYLQLLFFPVVLTADYSFNAFHISRGFLDGDVIRAVFLDTVVLYAVLRAYRFNRTIFFGGMWFFLSLLPVCQIFPHHEIMAEHYLYIPMAGFAVVACVLFNYLLNCNRRFAMALLVAVLLLFSFRTVIRNRDWRDSMTLWSKVLEVAPECARAHDDLGSVYFKQNEYEKALYHYRKAVAIRPRHAIFHNNLGMALGATGDIDGAEKEFRKAINLDRDLAAAYNNLGIVFFNKAEYRQAAVLFRKSARMNPGSSKAWFNYGVSSFNSGNIKNAERAFHRAVKLNSKYAEAYKWLGRVQYRKGHYRQAMKSLKSALVLNPGYTEAYWFMALVLEKTGDTDRALWYLKKAAGTTSDAVLKRKIEKKIRVLKSTTGES